MLASTRSLVRARASSAACSRAASRTRWQLRLSSSSSSGGILEETSAPSLVAQLPRTGGAMLRARTSSSLRIDRTCSQVSRSIPARSNASKAFRLDWRLASNPPINIKADRARSSVAGEGLGEERAAAEMNSVGMRSGDAVNSMRWLFAVFFGLFGRSFSQRWTARRFRFRSAR